MKRSDCSTWNVPEQSINFPLKAFSARVSTRLSGIRCIRQPKLPTWLTILLDYKPDVPPLER